MKKEELLIKKIKKNIVCGPFRLEDGLGTEGKFFETAEEQRWKSLFTETEYREDRSRGRFSNVLYHRERSKRQWYFPTGGKSRERQADTSLRTKGIKVQDILYGASSI